MSIWVISLIWTLYFSFLFFSPALSFNLHFCDRFMKLVGSLRTQRAKSYTFLTRLLLRLVYSRLIQAWLWCVCVCVSVCVRLCFRVCVNCRAVQEACIYRNTWLRSDLTEAVHYSAQRSVCPYSSFLSCKVFLRFWSHIFLYCEVCIQLKFLLFYPTLADRQRITE